MTQQKWIIALIAAILFAALAYAITNRYEITPVRLSDGYAVYKLDRWTGQTWVGFMGGSEWFEYRH